MPDEALFKKVAVKVPNRSGYDKSYHNIFTGVVGDLVPIACEEVIPNHAISKRFAVSTQLPPLASDTFMRLTQRTEAFFVPTRLLMRNYDKWITRNHKITTISGTTESDVTIAPPCLSVPLSRCKAGSLMDYLGIMTSKSLHDTAEESSVDPRVVVSAFPVLAYLLVWDEWYRNSLVQKSVFYTDLDYPALNSQSTYSLALMKSKTPMSRIGSASVNGYIDVGKFISATGYVFPLADGTDALDLRKRNFPLDYFTSATPQPQNGDASVIKLDTSGSETEISISAIRAANSLQQFEERQNLAGNRLVDFVKAQYGANLKDSIAQRPVLLGSASFDVYSKGIYQSSQVTSMDQGNENNPFNSVGVRYGSAYAEGSDFIIKDFVAQEPGYILILTSLVPRVTYGSGLKRYLTHYVGADTQGDMANPILQNVGNQPIYQRELNDRNIFGLAETDFDAVFGYSDRYAEFKSNNDEIHGLIRDGYELESFALQRNFHAQSVEISSDFLQIPDDYLDKVFAVSEQVSGLTYWCDCYIQSFESMPLSRYSIPTLQDPAYEHGRTEVLSKGGVRID